MATAPSKLLIFPTVQMDRHIVEVFGSQGHVTTYDVEYPDAVDLFDVAYDHGAVKHRSTYYTPDTGMSGILAIATFHDVHGYAIVVTKPMPIRKG